MKELELNTYDISCQINIIRQEHPGCGLEKLYYQLKPDWIGRDKFVALYISLGYGIVKTRKFSKTTIPTHINYPNLIEGLLIYGLNTVWQSDITYYRIDQDHYYIVFIVDVFSRRILGYVVSNHMRALANMQALDMAFKIRDCDLSGTIHHSDRGSQYVEHEYLGTLKQNNMLASMGLRGQDNAYVERVNGIIKNEYLKHWSIDTFKQLQAKLKQAVDHYNTKRPHNSLPNRMAPVEFEKELEINFKDLKFSEWIHSDKIKHEQKKHNFETSDLEEKNLICPIIDY